MKKFKLYKINQGHFESFISRLFKLYPRISEYYYEMPDRHCVLYDGGIIKNEKYKGMEMFYFCERMAYNPINKSDWLNIDEWINSKEDEWIDSKENTPYMNNMSRYFGESKNKLMEYFIVVSHVGSNGIKTWYVYDFEGRNLTSNHLKPESIDSDFPVEFINKLESGIFFKDQSTISPTSRKPRKDERYKNGTSNQILSPGENTSKFKVEINAQNILNCNVSRSVLVKDKLTWSFNSKFELNNLLDLIIEIEMVLNLGSGNKNIKLMNPVNKELDKRLNISLFELFDSDPEKAKELIHFDKEDIFDNFEDFEKISFTIPRWSDADINDIKEINDDLVLLVIEFANEIWRMKNQIFNEYDSETNRIKYIKEKIKIKFRDDIKAFNILKYYDVWDYEFEGKDYFFTSGKWYENHNVYSENVNDFLKEKIIEKKHILENSYNPEISLYKSENNNLDMDEDIYNKFFDMIYSDNSLLLDKKMFGSEIGTFELADIVRYEKSRNELHFYAVKIGERLSSTKRVFEQAIIGMDNLRDANRYLKKIEDHFNTNGCKVFYWVDVFYKIKNPNGIMGVQSYTYKVLAQKFILGAMEKGFIPIIRTRSIVSTNPNFENEISDVINLVKEYYEKLYGDGREKLMAIDNIKR